MGNPTDKLSVVEYSHGHTVVNIILFVSVLHPLALATGRTHPRFAAREHLTASILESLQV